MKNILEVQNKVCTNVVIITSTYFKHFFVNLVFGNIFFLYPDLKKIMAYQSLRLEGLTPL